MLYALIALTQGQYIPWWNTVGIAEDHPLIDMILTLFGY